MRLTDLSVRNLKPPERGQKIYVDATLKGFGVRVSQGGSKTFVLTYGIERKRVTIGRYPIISLAQAREKAKNILAQRTLHPDRPPITFGDAIGQYVKKHVEQNNKPSTQTSTKRLLKHFDKLKSKQLAEVTPRAILDVIDGLSDTPSEANHAYVAVRSFLRWTVAQHFLPHDPLQGTKLPSKTTSRSRLLTDDEIKLVLTCARSRGIYGTMMEILLITGQRLNQVATLHSDYIYEDRITWPAEAMKGNKEHTIPLTGFKRLLPKQEGYLFTGRSDRAYSGFSNGKKYFDKHVDIPHWTTHDLRRTFATGHAKLGTPPHIVERLLAHSTGTISGVAAIYNRHTYFEEMKDALLNWEQHLNSICPWALSTASVDASLTGEVDAKVVSNQEGT